jgi:hypothetical protein
VEVEMLGLILQLRVLMVVMVGIQAEVFSKAAAAAEVVQ